MTCIDAWTVHRTKIRNRVGARVSGLAAAVSAIAWMLLLPRPAFGHAGHFGHGPVDSGLPFELIGAVALLGVLALRWIRSHRRRLATVVLSPKTHVRGLVVGLLVVVLASPALAADPNLSTPAPGPNPNGGKAGTQSLDTVGPDILVYGPTSGGYAETTPGVNVTVWDSATWSSKTTADFAAFDAIVFGDQPICFGDPNRWAAAVANRQVWTQAITGNVIMNGTDPDYHGKSLLVHQSVQFAATDDQPSPGPGLYVSLSCAYHGEPSIVPVALLGGLGEFTVTGVQSCPTSPTKWPTTRPWRGSTTRSSPTGRARPTTSSSAGRSAISPSRSSRTPRPFRRCPSTPPRMASKVTSTCSPKARHRRASPRPTTPMAIASPTRSSWRRLRPGPAPTRTTRIRTATDCSIPGKSAASRARVSICRPEMHRVTTFWATLAPRGMSAWDCANQPGIVDATRHVTDNFVCMNQPPDPNHKDVFIEIDWQDCRKGEYACPEVQFFGVTLAQPDDTHHAPDVYALADMVATFAAADVSNPDGLTGVNLHIVVDEGIPHTPNCERGSVDRTYFGTPRQKGNLALLAARAQAVRYVWSGHSSVREDSDAPGCALPGDFLQQGLRWSSRRRVRRIAIR